MQARQFFVLDNLPDALVFLRLQHALNPQELPLQGEILVELLRIHVKRRGQLVRRDTRRVARRDRTGRVGIVIHFLLVDVKGVDHDAHGQFFAVAVHDAAAGRVAPDLVRRLRRRAPGHLPAIDNLHPEQPARQHDKCAQDQQEIHMVAFAGVP